MSYRKPILLMTIVVGLLAGGCQRRQFLFNGKDLTGWTCYPPKSKNIWSVGGGSLRCSGNPDAYIRTLKQYANYHLHLEYRWPGFPSNSGALLHTAGTDKFWPECFEIQLRSGDAGDIIIHGPATASTPDGRVFQTDGNPFVLIPGSMASTENPPGQWNSLDVFCRNDSIEIFVNGYPQNRLTGLSRSTGAVCLQSQGTPVEFANIYIVPINPP